MLDTADRYVLHNVSGKGSFFTLDSFEVYGKMYGGIDNHGEVIMQLRWGKLPHC